MTLAEEPKVDGRRARRDRGRLAVIDAMIDLVRQGGPPPSTEAIAERAGVSVASVFRYFDSVEDLQRQTTERFFERYADLFEIPAMGEGSFEDRLDGYVRARSTLYEVIGPVARLARARAVERPDLADRLHDLRRVHAAHVRRHFAPELARLGRADRQEMVALITTLTSHESWEQLSGDLRHSSRAVERAWTAALTSLLTAPRR